jgi:hypothetical protein
MNQSKTDFGTVHESQLLRFGITWRREHQVALLLGAVLGIVAGFSIGFNHNGIHLATLQQWAAGGSGIRWAVLGALFGAGVIYVQRLLRI